MLDLLLEALLALCLPVRNHISSTTISLSRDVSANFITDDSDDEHHTSAHAGAEGVPPVGYDTQTAPPAHDSDAESLHEAQQEYNEAVEAAADSDASSEELEELQEAREEVQEEQEEYYDD